ncbi:MAG: sigma-70 family RNA polymerase sigma factor [Candidatus Brocadiia bacterium]
MRSDEELMAEVADGDMDAFGELVRRHQDSAWRIAYHYVGDRAEAEDLAQEAFLKVLDAASGYRPTARFTTYLYRVIANLCIDYHRKKRPDYPGRLPPQQSPLEEPDQHLAQEERDRAIQRALDELPDRQRMATVLRYYEELSLSEIAKAMDTTYKAVERLLARARQSLTGHLGDFPVE